MQLGQESKRVWKYPSHSNVENEQPVASEALVTLSINGQEFLTFACTPFNLEALAVGFLFNEGIITTLDDISDLHLCGQGSQLDLWLTQSVRLPHTWTRTSGCGSGMTQAATEIIPLSGKPQFSTEQINNSMLEMLRSQEIYPHSGGLHCSALSDGMQIYLLAEDIGRHNTLDKLAGRLLLENIQLSNPLLLTTGRISSEMMQKAVRLGATVVVSLTSPTSLSIAMAEKAGVTLVGYARRGQFSVYSHPFRLTTFQEEVVHSQT
jgi:FdhD protein